GDDGVGEGDEARRGEARGGDEQRRQVEPSDDPALLLGWGEDDRLYLRVGTEEVERLWEERVRVPVVERHVRRRTQDDKDTAGVDAEPVEHSWVGLEVREVVLLLEARVALQLWRPHAEPRQPLRRARLRDGATRARPRQRM